LMATNKAALEAKLHTSAASVLNADSANDAGVQATGTANALTRVSENGNATVALTAAEQARLVAVIRSAMQSELNASTEASANANAQ
ncbi:MAG: hypothetical protein WC050_04710, partial [Candidatus Paceibacterota bacterium]